MVDLRLTMTIDIQSSSEFSANFPQSYFSGKVTTLPTTLSVDMIHIVNQLLQVESTVSVECLTTVSRTLNVILTLTLTALNVMHCTAYTVGAVAVFTCTISRYFCLPYKNSDKQVTLVKVAHPPDMPTWWTLGHLSLPKILDWVKCGPWVK